MQENLLAILMLFGIFYAGISARKKTKALQKLHHDLPEEGKRKLEESYPLLKNNGKPMVAIYFLSSLVGIALFLWVLLKMILV
ncbi:MAG: hypothetical protein KJ850_02270 [Gammaproteobacteria bacterium]|nr:hypothetical protein [Gammaproteobacteria bacterium]MBU1623848.1 hypothetical protein [Gammaproteobacteria bacterium]MBU1982065.1 hypothetical protein [Gammaproteobacteria bacterium]